MPSSETKRRWLVARWWILALSPPPIWPLLLAANTARAIVSPTHLGVLLYLIICAATPIALDMYWDLRFQYEHDSLRHLHSTVEFNTRMRSWSFRVPRRDTAKTLFWLPAVSVKTWWLEPRLKYPHKRPR